MKDAKAKMKVLWAVDAFDDVPEITDQAVLLLRSLNQHTVVEIDPVYVLGPIQLGIQLEFNDSWSDLYLPATKKALQMQLNERDVPGLGEPIVLIQRNASLRGSVETLVSYAKERGYDLILTGSHGNSGLKRMMLGSFAEELLLRSNVPVLVVGGKGTVSHSSQQQILIPSDLSNPDSPFFDAAFKFARTMDAKVTLLHAVPRPADLVFQSGVYLLSGAWTPTPIYLEATRDRKTNEASLVMVRAQKHSLACTSIVDDTSSTIVEAILQNAVRTQATLIAIEAQSGPFAAALLGSVTRQVIRQAPCPVWVYRGKEPK